MINKRPLSLIIFIFSLLAQPLLAQLPIKKDLFLFPIMPGQTNSLTGNMGEIRSNHFHGGLDIRTNYTIGLPVYASQDGYIWKVSVETHAYGKLIYIRHSSGYVTLYAHLEDFYIPLARYVLQKQYEKETFAIELTFKPNQFPVKKGDLIAYSGNTGASAGPHLHWEIRDTAENTYNPLLFGFPEIKDNRKPYPIKLAIRPIEVNSRVNDIFERDAFAAQKVGDHYVIPRSIPVYGTLALELWSHDRVNDGTQVAGVMCKEMSLDGQEIYCHNTASLSKKELKQINNHLAYDIFHSSGNRYEKLYMDDGNVLKTPINQNQHGYITILDTLKHTVRIQLSDPYGNATYVIATLQGKPPRPKTAKIKVPKNAKPRFQYTNYQNVLKTSISNISDSDNILCIYTKGEKNYLERAYIQDGKAIFLYDLRKGLPDSLLIAGHFDKSPIHTHILYPNSSNKIDGQIAHVELDSNCVFDTTFIKVEEDSSNHTFRFGTPQIPLQHQAIISFPIPEGKDKEKLSIFQMLNNQGAARWVSNYVVNNEIRGRIKYFGTYKLLYDRVPPTIKPIRINRKTMSFYITDNMSGIKSWRCTINGQWVLMNFEHKRNLIYSEKLNPETDFDGEVILTLKDNAGNETAYRTSIR